MCGRCDGKASGMPVHAAQKSGVSRGPWTESSTLDVDKSVLPRVEPTKERCDQPPAPADDLEDAMVWRMVRRGRGRSAEVARGDVVLAQQFEERAPRFSAGAC